MSPVAGPREDVVVYLVVAAVVPPPQLGVQAQEGGGGVSGGGVLWGGQDQRFPAWDKFKIKKFIIIYIYLYLRKINKFRIKKTPLPLKHPPPQDGERGGGGAFFGESFPARNEFL